MNSTQKCHQFAWVSLTAPEEENRNYSFLNPLCVIVFLFLFFLKDLKCLLLVWWLGGFERWGGRVLLIKRLIKLREDDPRSVLFVFVLC